jgi:hypothetical protein
MPLGFPDWADWFTSFGGDEPHYLLAASQVHATTVHIIFLSTCYQAIQMQIDLLYV